MSKVLFKDTVEEILEAEMEEYLGYEKHNVQGNNLGVNIDGQKDILGIWIGENESATFWLD